MAASISSARSHRKSDVVPLFSLHPEPAVASREPATTTTTTTLLPPSFSMAASAVMVRHRLARVSPSQVQPSTQEPSGKDNSSEGASRAEAPVVSRTKPASLLKLNRIARSVLAKRKQECHGHADSANVDNQDTGNSGNQHEEDPLDEMPPDPWASVLSKIVQRKGLPVGSESGSSSGTPTASAAGTGKRSSLAQVLQSRQVKNLVKQALVTRHWTGSEGGAATTPLSSSSSSSTPQHSSVMQQWMDMSALRQHLQPQQLALASEGPSRGTDNGDGEHDDDGEDEETGGIRSGFDVGDGPPSGRLHGRALLLEESCRRALAVSGEHRSPTDVQALQAWFQLTKLRFTTNFDRLQGEELALLCRRMTLTSCHAREVVFRQGEEGDALYLVLSGVVEVRVAQRVLGERVECTVCELSRGDYFGERALLQDDVRAATIVAQSACELVRITRDDYNLMLRADQQAFWSRMPLAASVTKGIGEGTDKGDDDAGAGTGSTGVGLGLGFGLRTSSTPPLDAYVRALNKPKGARSRVELDMLSAYLQTLKFFRALPRTFVRELCAVLELHCLMAGQVVFHEGDIGDQFYIILTGSVEVVVSAQGPRGQLQPTKLIHLTEGAHFGELALMKGQGLRSATVRTRESCQLLVICEADYDATLRRLQKHDLARRVAVLDRMPLFQTAAWTAELLRELSYVLSELKVPSGRVLFREGEKAQHLYLVVRGELLVSKTVAEVERKPIGAGPREQLVERCGRFRVIGDEAVAGETFHEPVVREVTVTASTPVEVLVLTKYDVFHRLSRTARETLRQAAAKTRGHAVLDRDRAHKTRRWQAMQKRMLSDHLNHDRLRKLLPGRFQPQPQSDPQPGTMPQVERGLEVLEEEEEDETETPRSPHHEVDPVVALRAQRPLVDANEVLLLPPVAMATAQCLPSVDLPRDSLARHVMRFNPDAPPRPRDRRRKLARVLRAEARRRTAVLNEGNPMAYDNAAVSSTTDRPASVPSPLPPQQQRQRQQEHLFQDNYIFSQPATPSRSQQPRPANAVHLSNHEDTPAHSSASTDFQMSFVGGDPILVAVRNADERDDARRRSVSFQLLLPPPPCGDIHTTTGISKQQQLNQQEDANDQNPSATDVGYFLLARSKFAVLPLAADRVCPREVEERVRQAVGEQCASRSSNAALPLNTNCSDHHSHSTSSGSPPGGIAGPSRRRGSVVQQTTPASLSLPAFTTFQRLIESIPSALSASPSSSRLTTHKSVVPARPFAVIGVVLSKREQIRASCEEPMLCVYSLHAREGDALQQALQLSSASVLLRQAMVCIVPLNEWLHCEDAHDWCAQIERERQCRRDLALDTCNSKRGGCRPSVNSGPCLLPSSLAPGTSSPPPFLTARRKAGSMCGSLVNARSPRGGPLAPTAIASARPEWEVEKEMAHRLHQFVCARLTAKMTTASTPTTPTESPKAARVTGFTPRPTVTLQDKLETLQEFLGANAMAQSGSPHGQASMLGKFRQVKRFGSIMRSHLARGSVMNESATTGPVSASTAGSFANDRMATVVVRQAAGTIPEGIESDS